MCTRAHMHSCMPDELVEVKRTACGNCSSLSTMWVLGIELRTSGLAASTSTHRAISLAQGVHNFLELGLAARMIGICFGDSCSHSSSRNRLTFSFNLSGYTFADSHLNVFPRRPVQGHPSAECGRLTLAIFVIFLLMR